MAKKHQFTKKNALSVKTFFAAGLPLALAVCIFSGCATKGPQTPSGTLTITGIPAEYEGRHINAMFSVPPPPGTIIGNFKTVESPQGKSRIAIASGEASLPLNYQKLFGKGDGYAGNDTREVEIYMASKSSPEPVRGSVELTPAEKEAREREWKRDRERNFVFVSVSFEGGVAAVQWADIIEPGIVITFTGIPKEYEGKEVSVTLEPSQLSSGLGTIKDGAAKITCKKEAGGAYLPNTLTGTKSMTLIVSDDSPKDRNIKEDFAAYALSAYSLQKGDRFQFKNVQISFGEATVKFADGVKQK